MKYGVTPVDEELNRDRAQEARRILVTMGLITRVKRMSIREQNFVEQLNAKLECYGDNMRTAPSAIFWLRELKDRYLR